MGRRWGGNYEWQTLPQYCQAGHVCPLLSGEGVGVEVGTSGGGASWRTSTSPHPMIPALLRAKARLVPGTLPDQTVRMTQGSAVPAAQSAGRRGACVACVGEHVTLATVWEACLLFPLVLPMTHSPLPDLQPPSQSWSVGGGIAHQQIPRVEWRCLQVAGTQRCSRLSLGGGGGGSGRGALKWGSKRVEVPYSLFLLKPGLQI